jgi:hypothetical protein
MNINNFEKSWKAHLRLDDIITADLKSEEKYKKFAQKVWLEALDNQDVEQSEFCSRDGCGCE